MSPEAFTDRFKSFAPEPEIITNDKNGFVIIGSRGHGRQLTSGAVIKIIDALTNVTVLKIEGTERIFEMIHPFSTETITKAAVGQAPISFLREFDGEDVGQKLLKYGITEELAEAYVPCFFIRQYEELPQGFFDEFPIRFEKYKERFSFINIDRAVENFARIANYWAEHQLSPKDLDHFSYDFEKFMGKVREYEFWLPDLREFRKSHKGKIAISCGDYHTNSVKTILEGNDLQKPNWETHINDDPRFMTSEPNRLRLIYHHIETALAA